MIQIDAFCSGIMNRNYTRTREEARRIAESYSLAERVFSTWEELFDAVEDMYNKVLTVSGI